MSRAVNLASLVCVFCLVSAGGALAQSASGTAGTPQTTGAAGSAAAMMPVSAATRTYVDQAALTDRFEIASSRLALKKSHNIDVRNFATQMIHDHSQSTSALKKLLAGDRLDVSPPAQLDANSAKLMTELQTATGASFDQLYVRIMLQGHRQALQLHQGYAASGDNDDLKKFALDVTKVVERHLSHITEITKKLNVSNAG